MKAIALNSWAGLLFYRCEVLGETKTRYRVRLLEDTMLPGRRRRKTGDVVLIPKYALRDLPHGAGEGAA
jgi:hypothetical protein